MLLMMMMMMTMMTTTMMMMMIELKLTVVEVDVDIEDDIDEVFDLDCTLHRLKKLNLDSNLMEVEGLKINWKNG
jgi:hypothetical protein